MILEAPRQQPQSEAKEAQIAAILPMQLAHPIIACGTDAEIDDPEIGQTRRDQQAAQALRVAEMAFMNLEPATFLIRKEGLDLRARLVVLHGCVQIREIGDEINRFLERQFPDR